MRTKEQRKAQYLENRKALIELSGAVKMAVKEGIFNSVNEGLTQIYKDSNPDIKEFNTFHQWKELGKTIKKGSKAFTVWGQPKENTRPKESNPEEDEDFKFWPLCYLFADTQVV